MTIEAETPAMASETITPKVGNMLKNIFIRSGALPLFMIAAIVIFTIASKQFLTVENITNVARQSVYLILVSLGQMIVLITGGFDLAVGTSIAMTSVVSAMTMVYLGGLFPDATWLIILPAILTGFFSALLIGTVNGIGVAKFGVSPFIMTLGVQSVGAGIALFLTGGVPIGNLPYAFGDFFGFGQVFGVPVPVLLALIAMVVMWVLMNRTRTGARIYAIGGNIKAAHLSGINTTRSLFLAYIICAALASIAGILLSARVESGETNLGGTMAMESIAACVIAGVSLRGGMGRVENVVLGAFFIVLVENGMNIMEIGSYMQMVLLGSLLIFAVVIDQLRYRMLLGNR